MDGPSRESGPQAPEPDPTIPVRALLVEDEEQIAEFVAYVFKDDPHLTTEVFGNAEDALTRLREAKESGNQFDLVISDLGLPGMDGMQLAETVRTEELAGRFTLFTGSARQLLQDITEEELQNRGIANVIEKPARVSPFLTEVMEARRTKQPQP